MDNLIAAALPWGLALILFITLYLIGQIHIGGD